MAVSISMQHLFGYESPLQFTIHTMTDTRNSQNPFIRHTVWNRTKPFPMALLLPR